MNQKLRDLFSFSNDLIPLVEFLTDFSPDEFNDDHEYSTLPVKKQLSCDMKLFEKLMDKLSAYYFNFQSDIEIKQAE